MADLAQGPGAPLMPNIRSTRPRKSKPPAAMLIRQLHTYLSVFIAPSILFFAVTGALQVYSLHKAHGGYRPAPLIETLASVHKDQVLFTARPEPKDDAAPRKGKAAKRPPKPFAALSTQVLKAFFALVSACLAATTLLGLWMAAKHSRRKWLCLGLFLAGAVLPLLTLAA